VVQAVDSDVAGLARFRVKSDRSIKKKVSWNFSRFLGNPNATKPFGAFIRVTWKNVERTRLNRWPRRLIIKLDGS